MKQFIIGKLAVWILKLSGATDLRLRYASDFK